MNKKNTREQQQYHCNKCRSNDAHRINNSIHASYYTVLLKDSSSSRFFFFFKMLIYKLSDRCWNSFEMIRVIVYCVQWNQPHKYICTVHLDDCKIYIHMTVYHAHGSCRLPHFNGKLRCWLGYGWYMWALWKSYNLLSCSVKTHTWEIKALSQLVRCIVGYNSNK